MLTALTADAHSTVPRRAVAHVAQAAARGASAHLLDQFADLAHAAEAAARRAAMAR